VEDLDYPFHDWSVVVTHCGRICFKGRKIHLSHVFAGQQVGIKQVDDRVWLVSFMHYDLGYFDDETCRLEPIKNPFEPTVLPMRSAVRVKVVVASLSRPRGFPLRWVLD
jgi:putative transposase